MGNWPGVTVDKREGTYKKDGQHVDIVDLPGIYSLSPYTPEEVIARNFVLDERPDCVINIVDATNLERNLYLTTQLMEVDIPLIVALNMTDVLEKNGDKLDVKTLEKRLKDAGVPAPLFHAVKLVEKDELEVKSHPSEAAEVERYLKANDYENGEFGGDSEAEIADARYKLSLIHI